MKGLRNTFGVYDYTNDTMFTHCYRHKKSDPFIDFIGKVDSLYGPSVKQIFLVLDNASIHRSKKTQEALKKMHHRIVLMFLPTKAPELNLIEVRWMWMQRKAIDNSTFEDESDIGMAVAGGLKITTFPTGKQPHRLYRRRPSMRLRNWM